MKLKEEESYGKSKKFWKSTLLIIYEKKIIQYILIVAILFLPVASIVSNKLLIKKYGRRK